MSKTPAHVRLENTLADLTGPALLGIVWAYLNENATPADRQYFAAVAAREVTSDACVSCPHTTREVLKEEFSDIVYHFNEELN